MIDLQPFCADPEIYRRAINAPWSRDGYTFATDGALLIRVPYRAEVEDREGAPQVMGNRIGAIFAREPADWFDIPEFPPPASDECKECEGDGWVSPRTQYNVYDDQECKTCDGKGRVQQDKPVEIGGFYFADRLLTILRQLPNVKIGPLGPNDAARVTFDGGDGLLMPRRK
jgi:hypothetical protein